jgi:hypothetical protein
MKRPAPKLRAVKPDVTFDPADPFNSYHKLQTEGPPSHWTPEKKAKWHDSMNKYFIEHYGDKVT